MSVSGSDTDADYTEYDTVSDCDADETIDDVYTAAINIISHVSNNDSLGPEYKALIDGYHKRHACQCSSLLPRDADSYHLKLLSTVLESYYGSDYTAVFVADVPLLAEELTHAQMLAMFPDERVLFQVQFRLIKEGMMDQLPRLEALI